MARIEVDRDEIPRLDAERVQTLGRRHGARDKAGVVDRNPLD